MRNIILLTLFCLAELSTNASRKEYCIKKLIAPLKKKQMILTLFNFSFVYALYDDHLFLKFGEKIILQKTCPQVQNFL